MDVMTIIVAILVFGSIIFVHELGHLIFAKKYGVYCYEFSLGMGPKLFSKKYGETVYSIRAIPIGGFVSMAGEDDEGKDIPEGRRLNDISKLKQAMVIFAGAFFNFIFALVIVFAINIYTGEVEYGNIVGEVMEGTLAEEYGLEPGYEITEINEVQIKTFEEAKDTVLVAKEAGSINIVFEKDGKEIIVDEANIDENFILGFKYAEISTSRNIFAIIKNSIVQFVTITTAMVGAFANLILKFSTMKDNVGGPIMVINAIGESSQIGVLYLMQMVALLSVNIGIVNLLPIPGLDGSKILIAIGEYITKRDLPRKLYIGLSLGGVVFLLLLMVLITIKDITNLI